MNKRPPYGTRPVPTTPENIVQALRDKDRIIRIQAKRIELLEHETSKLRKERDTINTKLALLSHKLELNSQSKIHLEQQPSMDDGGRSGEGGGGCGSPTSRVREGHVINGGIRTPPMSGTPIHQRGQNNSGGRSRQRTQKREDDEKVKRSRAWANAYELSQDLHDKQLEMLERKYGGHLRAKRAARIIQQAYRRYRMTKNFDRLRYELEERRLRRLSEFGRSKTIWTDMVASIEEKANLHSQYFASDSFNNFSSQHVSYSDHFQKKTLHTSSVHNSSSRTVRVMHKSHSVNVITKESSSTKERRTMHRTAGLDLDTILENSRLSHVQPSVAAGVAVQANPNLLVDSERNNNRNSYPELNDSSGSVSPQEGPVEPAIDLPSINFEKLLESKETDILNDSFHSDSSQDACQSPHSGKRHYNNIHDLVEKVDEFELNDDTLKGDQTLVNNSDACERTSLPKVNVETPRDGSTMEHIELPPGDYSSLSPADLALYMQIYGNTEVKLRKPKNDLDKNTSDASPIWKRKSAQVLEHEPSPMLDDSKRMSNISEASEPESMDGRESRGGLSSSPSSSTCSMNSEGGYHRSLPHSITDYGSHQNQQPRLNDKQRKRMYRIGLNLFNKKPERGIRYLIENRFLENRPQLVAKFLISRKGLSKQMIGEYLGNLQKQFNMDVLGCFCADIDLSGQQVDVALRTFQSYFRMPGEAQKIERLMEAFANRYHECNPDQVKKFNNVDTIFLLAFAIIMLNTDLHNKSIKREKKMKLSDFIKNLKGIDGGENLDPDLLLGIYERIKLTPFSPGADHVLQVMKVESMIAGKKPPLALPHRRLVCYCRLYEVIDPNKKEKLGLHQREVFLFNDMLMVTKIFSKKRNHVTYSFRDSFSLCGMVVHLFSTSYYKHGIRLTTNINGKVLFTFNARNEHDQSKFVADLKEAILEMNEMETLRIEEELHKQKVSQVHKNFNRHSKDSGVVDIELLKPTDPSYNRLSAPECGGLKKSTLSNSLIDLSESALRRSSGGSLDSGMVSAGSGSQEDNHAAAAAATASTPLTPAHQASTKHGVASASKLPLMGRKNKSSKTSLVDTLEI